MVVGLVGAAAGGAWLMGAALVSAGPSGARLDVAVAAIAAALMVGMALRVRHAAGRFGVAAFVFCACCGAAIVPRALGI